MKTPKDFLAKADKITAIQVSYSEALDRHIHPQIDELKELRDELFGIIPDEFKTMLQTLIAAEMIDVSICTKAGEYGYSFNVKGEICDWNGNSLGLQICSDDWHTGMMHGRKREKFFESFCHDNISVNTTKKPRRKKDEK